MTESIVPAVTTPVVDVNDKHVAELQTLQTEYLAISRRLGQQRPLLASLRARPDAAALIEANDLAHAIVADESRLTTLEKQITTKKVTIAKNRAKAEACAALVAETRTWLTPLLARLNVTDAELAACWDRSRELDAEHRELLDGTGDRQFRRSPVDPFREVRDTFEETLKRLERARLVRGQIRLPKKKGA